MFLISFLAPSVSVPSEKALHCSNTLSSVTSTALEALLPLNPTKFYNQLVRNGKTYHGDYPIPLDELAEILPELQYKHFSRDASPRKAILDD